MYTIAKSRKRKKNRDETSFQLDFMSALAFNIRIQHDLVANNRPDKNPDSAKLTRPW